MTEYDWAALGSLLYFGLEIGWLRIRVKRLEEQNAKLRKTLDSNGIYL